MELVRKARGAHLFLPFLKKAAIACERGSIAERPKNNHSTPKFLTAFFLSTGADASILQPATRYIPAQMQPTQYADEIHTQFQASVKFSGSQPGLF